MAAIFIISPCVFHPHGALYAHHLLKVLRLGAHLARPFYAA